MKTMYHGTTPGALKELTSMRLNLNKGGGEFGQGFYVGSSRRLAKRRAYHKTCGQYGNAQSAMNYKGNTFVIRFDNEKLRYYYLPKDLSKIEAIALFKGLKKSKSTSSYHVAPQFDYISGPVVGGKKRYLSVEQYKFDSKRIESVLNSHCTKIRITRSVI